MLQSDDGDNRLQLGIVAQADGRFAIDDAQGHVTDTFMLRRLRLQGRVARYFEFYLNLDFAGSVVNVRDAYVDTIFSPAFRIRAASILFGERGLTTTVAPDRDLGVELLGDLAGARLSYAVALTNGVIDGGWPWRSTGVPRRCATLVRIGRRTPDVLQLRRRDRDRTPHALVAAGVYYRGPFGDYTEFVRSRGTIAKVGVTGDADDVDHDAWGSWVRTGEPANQEIVRPRVNFDPRSGHYGALQVVARVERLAVSRSAITRGLAAPGASRTADAWTAGLSWYLNPYVKWHVGFTRTVFDGDAAARDAPRTCCWGASSWPSNVRPSGTPGTPRASCVLRA